MKKTLFIGCVESSYVLLEAMFEAGYPVAGIVTMEQSAINADFTPGGAAPVDAALNISSTHPVQNRVLYQALAGKVDKVEGMGLSHNDFTDALAQKLADIENGATKVTVDALFVAGSTNPVQSKTIQAALAAKVDKEVGKGLSSNDYTSAEKEKLGGIEAGAQKNPDMSGYALKSEIHDLPSGGTTDQVLAKASNSDHDYKWVTPSGGGGEGVVFVTYDVSTSEEIENAYQDGLAVYCIEGQYIYPLTRRSSATVHEFSGYSNEGFIVLSCESDSWTKADNTDAYLPPMAAIRAPSNLGTVANRGTSTLYAREDHVHKLPTASEVGAIADVGGDNGNFLRYDGSQFKWVAGTASKSDIGLSNVDNTSDLAKPISTATQTALDGKITAPSGATSGQFLVYNGTAWVAQTVPNASGVSF